MIRKNFMILGSTLLAILLLLFLADYPTSCCCCRCWSSERLKLANLCCHLFLAPSFPSLIPSFAKEKQREKKSEEVQMKLDERYMTGVMVVLLVNGYEQ